jgi:hypothetical protein
VLTLEARALPYALFEFGGIGRNEVHNFLYPLWKGQELEFESEPNEIKITFKYKAIVVPKQAGASDRTDQEDSEFRSSL